MECVKLSEYFTRDEDNRMRCDVVKYSNGVYSVECFKDGILLDRTNFFEQQRAEDYAEDRVL